MTRLLIVAADLETGHEWTERNVRFCVGFDRADYASAVDVVEGRLESDHRYEGIVMVTGSLNGPPSGRARLYARLRRLLADTGTVVVAPDALPGLDIVVDGSRP